jgi:hypothetical protein
MWTSSGEPGRRFLEVTSGSVQAPTVRCTLNRSTESEFLPEFGIFLAEPVSEELLQTGILFFKLH